MMRIIFNNGEIIDCQTINRIYIEECEMDKVFISKVEDSIFKEAKELNAYVQSYNSSVEKEK